MRRTVPAPSMTAVSPLRASVAGSIAGKTLEMVTLVAMATLLPRVLGPDSYGRFSVPLTIVTIGSLAMTLGGPAVLARYVPAAASPLRPALAIAIGLRLARGRGWQLLVVAVVAALFVAVDPSSFPPSTTIIVVAALAANVGALLCLQVGLGLGRTGAWSFRYPLHNAVLVVAVLGLHALFDSAGATAGILVASLATLGFGYWVVAPLRHEAVSDTAIPDGALRFGVLQASGAALTQFTQRGGILAAALLADSTVETGYTALAVGIALGATYAVLQTFTVMLPHLAATTDPEDIDESPLRRLAVLLLAVIVPAAVAAVAVTDSVVPIIFGSEYEAAAHVFVPAAAVVVLAPLNAVAVQVSALRFRPEVTLWCGLAAAVGFAGTALVATPTWGASGAVTATLVGMAASAIVATASLPHALSRSLVIGSGAGVAIVLAAGRWL